MADEDSGSSVISSVMSHEIGSDSEDSAFRAFLEKSLSESISLSESSSRVSPAKRSQSPKPRASMRWMDRSLESVEPSQRRSTRGSAAAIASSTASSRWLKHAAPEPSNQEHSYSVATDTIERERQNQFFKDVERQHGSAVDFEKLLHDTGTSAVINRGAGLSAADNLGNTQDDFASIALDTLEKDSIRQSASAVGSKKVGVIEDASAEDMYDDEEFDSGTSTSSSKEKNSERHSRKSSLTEDQAEEEHAINRVQRLTEQRQTPTLLTPAIAVSVPRPASMQPRTALADSLDLSDTMGSLAESRALGTQHESSSLILSPDSLEQSSRAAVTNRPPSEPESGDDLDVTLTPNDDDDDANQITVVGHSDASESETATMQDDSLNVTSIARSRDPDKSPSKGHKNMNARDIAEVEFNNFMREVEEAVEGSKSPSSPVQNQSVNKLEHSMDDTTENWQNDDLSTPISLRHSESFEHSNAKHEVVDTIREESSRIQIEKLNETISVLREQLRQQISVAAEYESKNKELLTELKLEKKRCQTAEENSAMAEDRIASIRFTSRETIERLEDQLLNSGAISDSRVVELQGVMEARAAEFKALETELNERLAQELEKSAKLESQALELKKRELEYTSGGISAASNRIEWLEQALAAKTAEAAEAEAKWAEQHSAFQAQLNELQNQVHAHATDDLASDRRALARIEELETELMNTTAAHRAKILKLEKQLDTQANLRRGRPSAKPNRSEDIDLMAKDLSSAVERINVLNSQLEESSNMREEQQMKIQDLNRQLEESASKHSEQIKSLCEERDNAKLRIQELGHAQLFAAAEGHNATMLNKIASLERVIKHLNEQLERAPSAEVLSSYDNQIRERDRQIDTLHAQLRLAKRHHSPNLLHFDQIESRLIDMEARLRKRDREIEEITAEAHRNTEREVEQCTQKWKGIVANKQTQLEQFRLELDKILEAIRIMQRNGVQVSFPVNSQRVG